jgi:hypothetical protein
MLEQTLAAFLAWSGPPPEACTCSPPSAADALASADLIFEGKLVGWAEVDDANGKRQSWRFRVERTWKVELPSSVDVTIPRNPCEPSFGDIGDRWLVYGNRHEEADRFIFADCGRALPISDAQADIEVLDAQLGKSPARQSCTLTDASDGRARLWLWLLGGCCVAWRIRQRH